MLYFTLDNSFLIFLDDKREQKFIFKKILDYEPKKVLLQVSRLEKSDEHEHIYIYFQNQEGKHLSIR